MRPRSLRRVLTSAIATVGVIGLGATAAAADGTYEVRSGDTLASIAHAHDSVSNWQELYAANDGKLADPHVIFPGQTLSLSGSGDGDHSDAAADEASQPASGTYTVQAGDTLASIARATEGVSSWQQLAEINGLANPHLIITGQSLALSGDSSGTSSAPAEDAPASEPSSSEAATSTGSVPESTWDALAQCESSGNWSINTGNGYYGGLQFALSSWQWVGGSGYPHEASKAEQIHRAELLLERQGWGAWPACSSQLGLR